ncbi:YegP family protein [Limosilactobacillus reuteri]|uniref:YegP family protein n=1 Tax=Limosilactobacillus reuteri TaxID=1598 RepID=UPI002B059EF2|nr:YegP family protein [Limosilactobacillus reuteri]
MNSVISKSKNDQYYFTINSANHEIVATSETYYLKESAEKTIDSIKRGISTDSFVIDATKF